MNDLWNTLVILQGKGVWGILPSVAILFGTFVVFLFIVSFVFFVIDQAMEKFKKWRGKA